MIRKLISEDREAIKRILIGTKNFSIEEIKIALELIDCFLNEKEQKDYEIFVDEESQILNGYVCIGPRPMTEGTYDLYWIAVNPDVQSKGIGSGLIKFVEKYLEECNGRLIIIETSGKPSYERERRFYEKNSYRQFVNIKDFYKVGDSLIIYGKYL